MFDLIWCCMQNLNQDCYADASADARVDRNDHSGIIYPETDGKGRKVAIGIALLLFDRRPDMHQTYIYTIISIRYIII
jgi:hypothetical protein